MPPVSAFAKYVPQAWPYRYRGQMHISRLCGGTPSDPKVAEGWIKTKLGADSGDLIRAQVAEVMVERGISAEQAASEISLLRSTTGFKRDSEKGLYIEGRVLKAGLKEAVSVAVNSGKIERYKWGTTYKQVVGWVAEHICVVEDRLYLGVHEPTGVSQRFVHTTGPQGRQTAIAYQEYVDDVTIDFTVIVDLDIEKKHPDFWAMVWLTGEYQGIGSSRSQGYGRYTVTTWERTTLWTPPAKDA